MSAIEKILHKFDHASPADLIIAFGFEWSSIIPDATAELASLRSALEEARELIASLEWITDTDLNQYCPVCERTRLGGHSPDCRLAAALAALPNAVRKE